MDRDVISALASRFYPALKASGFKGAGTTKRRLLGPVVHVINVQGSQGAHGCYINLGVHVGGLPLAGGGPPSDRPKEYECMFRQRLGPPETLGKGIWLYDAGGDATTMATAMVEEFRTSGEAYFAKYKQWPNDFEALVRQALAAPIHAMQALTLARVAQRLGLQHEAGILAQRAFDESAPVATGLRANAKKILEAAPGGITIG